MDSDPEKDTETAKNYFETISPSTRTLLQEQLRALLDHSDLPIDEFGSEANRWFSSSDEAREWLSGIASLLGSESGTAAGAVKVLDSNGTELLEGDSVMVIKDLKVKGGSSDLKRGTLIKKIHLIGDPGNIECRVNGSVLVLKTIFLKKD